MRCIDSRRELGSELASVQNPSSYIGGEIGQIVKPHSLNDTLFNFAMAFPDVYSIGMSNQAIKIIYNGLNKRDLVRCERVFAVEKDFEDLLVKKNLPLYTLETGMPLNQVDMIGFSIGYELGITGALSVLDLGRVPLLKKDRSENDPIVIAGGCGATNPAAFADFFDAVFIGEAEGGMFDLIESLARMKKAGAKRSEILKAFCESPFVWSEGMSEKTCGHKVARRAVWADFGITPSVESFMPLPNIKPVQDHGVVEIMRGCPNGCRFCHAGVYYRPQRVKTRQIIYDEVDRLVTEGGYREISLTSLSSADYPDIGDLLSSLNEKYRSQNVSFQLPSLKVNSFTLPILRSLSEVRKSGLTFAVETPEEAWQLRLNKEVYAQHLIEIIEEAKKFGWMKAKFYFMVGLPFPETDEKTEEQVIVDFLLDLQEKTRIQCNVNVGTFIPKPHTPYQWIRQISPEESDKKLSYIRDHLPRGKFHVGTHDIQTSFLEGLVSRGDRRAGEVIYNAYKKGCRLDAWENHLRENMPLWQEAFDEASYDVRTEILRERSLDEELPWDSVSLGPPKSYYRREWERNLEEVLTPRCMENCDHRCGVCNKLCSVRLDDKKSELVDKSVQKTVQVRPQDNIPVMYRVIFSFTKDNGAEYFSHLGQIELFNRAIMRSELPLIYTNGFNPLPRLEFASTLSLGIRSRAEIASVVSFDPLTEEEFCSRMNAELAHGIHIDSAYIFPVTNQRKRESLSVSLWGNEYDYRFFAVPHNFVTSFLDSDLANPFVQEGSPDRFEVNENDPLILHVRLRFKDDRPFRDALEEFAGKKNYHFVQITKTKTLAKSSSQGDENPVEYYTLYKEIAAINARLIEERNKRQSQKEATGVN